MNNMTTKTCARLAGIAGLLLGASAFAQPAVQCGTATIAPGASGSVTCDYLGTGSTVVGGQFDIAIGDANVTIDSVTCASGFTCPAAAADPFTVAFFDAGLQEVGDAAPVVTINVTVAAGAVPPLTIPVTVSGEAYADSTNSAVTPAGTSNGSITVQEGPGPGVLDVQPAALTIMAEANGAAGTGAITVSNTGAAGDDTFTPTCSLGAVTGAGTITVAGTPGALAPGASATVTASCSGSAVGMSTADYTCSATGPTVANATTAITCDVGMGLPVPNPAAASTVDLTIAGLVAGATGQRQLVISNTANNGSTFDVTCTAPTVAAFSAIGATSATGVDFATPFTLTIAATAAAVDPQPTDTITCTYSNGATGDVTVNLGILLRPEVIPTLSQWAMILMALVLAGFAGLALHRRREGFEA